MSSRELKFTENTAKTASLFKMAAKQAMKENLQCTSKYGHLRISQDICHVRMTDIEGFLTIYGHSDNLLNNKLNYLQIFVRGGAKPLLAGFDYQTCIPCLRVVFRVMTNNG